MEENLEEEIEKIKSRNKKVELDKAWETSWIRRICICILTYIIVVIYSYMINSISNIWFSALTENEEGQMLWITGRDDIEAFKSSGKFKERAEVTWKYSPDSKGLPSNEEALRMEEVENVLRRAMEKDKLSILTGIYTGGGERVWVYYTRTTRVFGERLNAVLEPFDLLPISIYTEIDPDWEEYTGMYELKEWRID